jgi:hypothetical protein
MPQYLFLFAYEAPGQRGTVSASGFGAEEIRAILLETGSEALALQAGIQLARAYVKRIYERESGLVEFQWEPALFRHWVECDPHEKWSAEQLSKVPRLRVDGVLAQEERHSIPA